MPIVLETTAEIPKVPSLAPFVTPRFTASLKSLGRLPRASVSAVLSGGKTKTVISSSGNPVPVILMVSPAHTTCELMEASLTCGPEVLEPGGGEGVISGGLFNTVFEQA